MHPRVAPSFLQLLPGRNKSAIAVLGLHYWETLERSIATTIFF
jgi:hypothetical protein